MNIKAAGLLCSRHGMYPNHDSTCRICMCTVWPFINNGCTELLSISQVDGKRGILPCRNCGQKWLEVINEKVHCFKCGVERPEYDERKYV